MRAQALTIGLCVAILAAETVLSLRIDSAANVQPAESGGMPASKVSVPEPIAWATAPDAPSVRTDIPLYALTGEDRPSGTQFAGVPLDTAAPTPNATALRCQSLRTWVRLTPEFPFGATALPLVAIGEGERHYYLAVNRRYVYFVGCQGCPGNGVLWPSTPIGSDEWHILTGVVRNTAGGWQWHLFVDGVVVARGPVAGNFVPATTFYMDARGGRSFPDEAMQVYGTAVYNRCLTTEEIYGMYESGPPPTKGMAHVSSGAAKLSY